MSDKENLKLWDAVCETDPFHTKHVGQRGGFTAIDAYYQIHCATEQFGAVGKGWGWEVNWTYPTEMSTHGLVIAEVNIWYTLDSADKVYSFPVVGAAKLESNNRVDVDAPKKALTDGITKGLSYLGFNADVFTGKFDDNKYVEEMREKYSETIELLNEEQQTAVHAKCTDMFPEDDKKAHDVSAWICEQLDVNDVAEIPVESFDKVIAKLDNEIAKRT